MQHKQLSDILILTVILVTVLTSVIGILSKVTKFNLLVKQREYIKLYTYIIKKNLKVCNLIVQNTLSIGTIYLKI